MTCIGSPEMEQPLGKGPSPKVVFGDRVVSARGALDETDAFLNVVHGDCLGKLHECGAENVHLAIADPPYFLDGLDANWKKRRPDSKRGTGVVGGLPVGMQFDPKQGRALQDFIGKVGRKMLPVMTPGAFAVVFIHGSRSRVFVRARAVR